MHYYGDSRPALLHLQRDDKKPTFGLNDAELEKAYQEADANDLSPHVYNHTRNTLHQAVNRVYGEPKYNDPDFEKAYKLKENLSRFAAFKTAEQTALLAQANDMTDAHSINRTYNVNYLRTEYVHAVRSSRAARNWERIQRDKDLYPNLRYVPSTAAEPRNEHKKLYGIVRPVDDEFWQVWFPPNDWGCRCSTEQVSGEPKSSSIPKGLQAPPPVMRNNPGITQKIMPDTHPIIKRTQNKEKVEKQGGYLERRLTRIELSTVKTGVYQKIGDVNALVSNAAISKTLSSLDIKDWHALQSIDKLSYTTHERRRPPQKRRNNIEWTHFYKVKDRGLYAVVWQMKGKKDDFVFHGFTYNITGEKE